MVKVIEMKFTPNIFKLIIFLIIVAFLPTITIDATTYTIVIDAGHGGKDPGAVDNGIKEKDVNLGVALLLGDMIKKNIKNIKVVYTRDKDTYLTLQQRADKANNAHGDLFISIHVNSVDKKNKNRRIIAGSSVYTLGLDKGDENMEVARRENAVISLESNYSTKYQGFDPNSDESYIIFEMSQKDNLNQSVIFANSVQQQLVNVAGRKDRGIHQAGFWVLWATAMPSVLIELDFICNPNSAKYIASQTGQKKIAEGIFNAVKAYFEQLANPTFFEEIPQDFPITDSESYSYSEGIILESTTIKKHKSINHRPYSSEITESQRRRRRSESSKQISANREIEVAMLLQPSSEIDITDTSITYGDNSQMGSNDNLNIVISEQSNNIVDNITENEIEPINHTQTPIKNKRTKSVARLNTYYTIKLFESSEHLMDNDPRLEGLSSVKIKECENGTYMYVWGEYNSKSDVTKTLNRVITRFPEATIIRVNKGSNKIIN